MNGETRANDGQPVKCFQYQQFQPSQRIFTRTDEHYITFANVANIVFFRMILLIMDISTFWINFYNSHELTEDS